MSPPMAWLGQADIILLALMLVNTVVIVCTGLALRDRPQQSRAFVSDAAARCATAGSMR